MPTSRDDSSGPNEWYTLDVDEEAGRVGSRLYTSREDALQDASLVLRAGKRPLALWNGTELLMNAAEIEDYCRRLYEDPAV